MSKLVFITGNPAKAAQIGWYLGIPLKHKKADLPELQSLDLLEVVEHKARAAYKLIKKPVLVEDTGLRFPVMGKLPGPFIKHFYEELGNEGLCRLLDNYSVRDAVATVSFGICTGKDVHIFYGTSKGIIAQKPAGKQGFGWDPIFIPQGWEKTWGQMTIEELKKSSTRQKALKKVEKWLKTNPL